MDCFTYRSSKRDGVYLYLADPAFFDKLPEDLKQLMGKSIFMLKFDLYPNRKIARVNAEDVIKALNEQGYFLRIDSTNIEEDLLNADRKSRGLAEVKNEKLISGISNHLC